MRAAGEIAAVVAVGSFLFAAFLVPPQPNGVLDAGGYRALRHRHCRLGCVGGVRCAAGAADRLRCDRPAAACTHLSPASIWSVASLVDIAGAWRWTAFLAAVVAIASIPVLRWSWTPMLFAGSLVTLIPLGLTGHSSAGGSHDLATNSLLIHLIAARAVGRRSAGAAGPCAARGPSTPTWPRGGSPRWRCGASWRWRCPGIVNAFVRIRPGDLLHTGYGWLVVAKIVGVVRARHDRMAAATVAEWLRCRRIRARAAR